MGMFKLRRVKESSFDLEDHKLARITYRWISSSGRHTYVADLQKTHLRNAVKMIEEDRHNIKTKDRLYSVLCDEEEFRALMTED